MLLTQQPTFDQIPNFLVGIAGEILTIKESLHSSTPNTEIEKPVGVSGAADHIDLDEQTIYRLVRFKKIPHHKQGKKLYFYLSELNEWIKGENYKSKNSIEVEERFLDANKNRRG